MNLDSITQKLWLSRECFQTGPLSTVAAYCLHLSWVLSELYPIGKYGNHDEHPNEWCKNGV